MRAPGLPVIILCLLAPATAILGGDRLGDWLDLPPAMRATIGNPMVKRMPGPALRATLEGNTAAKLPRSVPGGGPGSSRSRIRSIRITAPEETDPSLLKSELARAVLDHVWTEFLESKEFELISLDRSRLHRIGIPRLTGGGVHHDAAEDAWWRVRMGMPLEKESDYQLITMIVKYDAGFVPYAHFALGFRRKGGDTSHDFTIDPRAPWDHDESPGFKHFIAPPKELIVGLHVSNLYDWLYTQTNYRGMKVTLEFLPLAREQAVLLQNLPARPDPGNYGSFKTLRNNCASLSEELIEAILPLDERLGLPHPVADIPRHVARTARSKLGTIGKVAVYEDPEPDGGEPTADWTVHQAPNRGGTAEFRILRALPGAN